MRRTSLLYGFLLTLSLTCAAAPAAIQDDLRRQCQGADPDISIKGCTADIKAGHETKAILPLAYFNRGLSYTKKKLYDLAISDFTKTIALKPDLFQAYYRRGYAYEQKGQPKQAVADYNAAQRIAPDDATIQDALFRLGAGPARQAHNWIVPPGGETGTMCLDANSIVKKTDGTVQYAIQYSCNTQAPDNTSPDLDDRIMVDVVRCADLATGGDVTFREHNMDTGDTGRYTWKNDGFPSNSMGALFARYVCQH